MTFLKYSHLPQRLSCFVIIMPYRLMIAARGEKPNFDLPSNATYKHVDFRKNFDDLEDVSFHLFILFFMVSR